MDDDKKVVVLGDKEFPLRSEPPKGGRYVILAKRMRDARDDMQAFACMWDILDALVEPSVERRDLEDAVSDVEFEELEHAIAEAMKAYQADPPTQRPSPSAAGSPTTAPTSRVVSFSKGTVETVEAEAS